MRPQKPRLSIEGIFLGKPGQDPYAKKVSHIADSQFEDIPHRLFLDSSTLQTLQDYGGYLYENEALMPSDRIHRDAQGNAKLEALRWIMAIAERAPFQFALSNNSFVEVKKKADPHYLQWAYDVLHHWHACLQESREPLINPQKLAAIESAQFNYLGAGDRSLIRDAVQLECDTFLTMENKLPKNAAHIEKVIGLRVLSPVGVWAILKPWAALFR